LRHIPVAFEDLEDEAQQQLEAIDADGKLAALELSLSPINLRRASSQVDSIRAELEEMHMRAAQDSSSWLILSFSFLMLVGVVGLAVVLKMHFESGNLSVETILLEAEVLLNHLLQD
jgi:hypothetical protein